MREIVFRGKRKDLGTWIKGFYFKRINPFTENGLPITHNIADIPPFGTEVIPETVGQFTGLVDRNGKRIFEGDIIKDCDYDHIYTVRYFGDEGYPAFDCHPELQFCECNGLSHLVAASAIEVIGNIHDNPELLERSNENAE